MLTSIKAFLDQFKVYLIIVAIALYPIVWFFGDEHGKGIARLQDTQAVVKEDKSVAADNKKAADAALQDEADLSKQTLTIQNLPYVPYSPTDDPCKSAPDRVQSLQQLIDKANK